MASAGSYYDIDDILAEQELTPVQFLHDCRGVGFLDESATASDIASDTLIEVPFWMARQLSGEHASIDVRKMKQYRQSFTSTLHAEPHAMVNLSKRPFFYTAGAMLALLCNDKMLISELNSSLQARFPFLLANALNLRGPEVGDFTGKLSSEERELFYWGYNPNQELEMWKARRDRSSATVGLKRKRA